MTGVREQALAAKATCATLAALGSIQRGRALMAMADALEQGCDAILAANALDMEAAVASGMNPQLQDRLRLDAGRVSAMAEGLRQIAGQPEALGRVLGGSTLPSGVEVTKVTVPMGLIAMVYEARPNVTADAVGLCVKTGNACILRGGSASLNSCVAIADCMRAAAVACGIPGEAIQMVTGRDHGSVDELLHLTGIVDVLIPRGGARLIRTCVENAQVPVIETGTGNCHTYVHESADVAMAVKILRNAKLQRPSVCNACESVLVDAGVAEAFLAQALPMLAEGGVAVHGCARVMEIAGRVAGAAAGCVVAADEEDWGREYLGLEVSIRVITGGVDEAVAHINRYGTGHSECIVAGDYLATQAFLNGVDAACVYVNASTRFTDGGMFGLGAEIGISTQKLHARGPMGAEALVTTKYICRGTGQVR